MHALHRRSRELELAAGLERDGTPGGHVEEADDVAILSDRLPAEQVLHALEQGADAAPALIGHGAAILAREGEFLVLGAESELRLRPDPRRQPRDQLVATGDRRHVDLVTSHAMEPAKRAATLKGPRPVGQEISVNTRASRHEPRRMIADIGWQDKQPSLVPSGGRPASR